MLLTEGKFDQVKNIITESLPKIYGSWWFSNVTMNDFKVAYGGHQFKMLVDCGNAVVPNFRGLPEKYRYAFDQRLSYNLFYSLQPLLRLTLPTTHNEMGKKVEQVLNDPGEIVELDDQESEEDPDFAVEPPKRKTKKEFSQRKRSRKRPIRSPSPITSRSEHSDDSSLSQSYYAEEIVDEFD